MNVNQSPLDMDTAPPELDGRGGPETAQGVGALLRASRLRCGEELRGVAQMLRIRYLYLEAIENGSYQNLPGPAYAIGFIRAYAEHLGLDSEEVVRRFKDEISDVDRKSELIFPVPIPESGIPGGAVLFVGVLVAVLAYGGWYASTNKEGFFADLISPIPDRLASLLKDDGAVAPGKSASQAITGEKESPPPPVAATTAPPEPAPPSPEPAVDESLIQASPRQQAPEASPAAAPQAEQGEAETPLADVPGADAGPDLEMTADAPLGDAAPPGEAPQTASALETSASGDQAAGPAPEEETEGLSAADNVDAGGQGPAAVSPVPPAGADRPQGEENESRPASEIATAIEAGPAEEAAETAAESEAVTAPATVPQEAEVANAADAADATDATDATDAADAPRASPVRVDIGPSAEILRTARVYGMDNENSRILVRAKKNSWIQVRDDIGKQLLLTRLLRAGDSYRVPDRPGLTLLTGNAGALEILIDGETVPPIGEEGTVRRGVSLDVERLRQGAAVIE